MNQPVPQHLPQVLQPHVYTWIPNTINPIPKDWVKNAYSNALMNKNFCQEIVCKSKCVSFPFVLQTCCRSAQQSWQLRQKRPEGNCVTWTSRWGTQLSVAKPHQKPFDRFPYTSVHPSAFCWCGLKHHWAGRKLMKYKLWNCWNIQTLLYHLTSELYTFNPMSQPLEGLLVKAELGIKCINISATVWSVFYCMFRGTT